MSALFPCLFHADGDFRASLSSLTKNNIAAVSWFHKQNGPDYDVDFRRQNTPVGFLPNRNQVHSDYGFRFSSGIYSRTQHKHICIVFHALQYLFQSIFAPRFRLSPPLLTRRPTRTLRRTRYRALLMLSFAFIIESASASIFAASRVYFLRFIPRSARVRRLLALRRKLSAFCCAISSCESGGLSQKPGGNSLAFSRLSAALRARVEHRPDGERIVWSMLGPV